MSRLSAFIRSVDSVAVRILAAWMTACFAALVVIVSYQVLSRLTEALPVWRSTEEIARGLFIWMVATGAALGVKYHEHFSMDLASLGHPPISHWLRYVKVGVILIIAGIFVVYGWVFLLSGFRRYSLTTGLPAAWSYAAFFVAGCMMVLFAVQDLAKLLAGDRAGPP